MNSSLYQITPRLRPLLLVLLTPLLLGACQSMALFEFDGMKAPNVILPPDVKTIGFLDRNLSFDSDSVSSYYKFNDVPMRDTLNYDTIRASNAYLGFSENLSELYQLDSIPFLQLPNQHFNGNGKYPELSWNIVDSLCKKTRSDVLVSLEDLQIYNNYKTYKGEENWGESNVVYYVVWRVYDPLLQKMYGEKIVIDSLYSEDVSYSYDKLIQEKMPSRKQINADVSYEVGSRYAKALSPIWKKYRRKYFISGHQDFTLAEYYLENDDLDKAMDLWRKHSNSAKGLIAARACYNLAFGYELKEDYQEAMKWIKKAIDKFQKTKKAKVELKAAKSYQQELVTQIQNQYLLDKFLGKEPKP